MKNDKVVRASKEKKIGAGSNPENKFKAGKNTSTSDSITSVIEQTKARTGTGLANEGTIISYDEER